MKSRARIAVAVAIIACIPFAAQGEQGAAAIPGIRRQPPPPESPLHTQHDVVVGIVNSIQESKGRVDITHQSFANLGDPQTTSQFRVRSISALKGLHTGQKVKFVAERIDGIATITWIVPVK